MPGCNPLLWELRGLRGSWQPEEQHFTQEVVLTPPFKLMASETSELGASSDNNNQSVIVTVIALMHSSV